MSGSHACREQIMSDESSGPIDIKQWRKTPAISGRSGTDADVDAGRAVFAVGGAPIDLEIPSCAIVREEGVGDPTPVIVIQAERLEDDTIAIGYRLLDGGTGIATLEEVEFLAEPDERFR
jgi:hypothetical protein